MRLNRLTENIYYTECDSNSDRPVLGYINGDRCSVMVDAGNSANHVKDYNFFSNATRLKKAQILYYNALTLGSYILLLTLSWQWWATVSQLEKKTF